MLIRALRLKSAIKAFVNGNESRKPLALSAIEWKQAEYLIGLTTPFLNMTNAISKSKGITINQVFNIYNELFDHLDKALKILSRKTVTWKKMLHLAVMESWKKLSEYYGNTVRGFGNRYAAGTALDPQYKLKFFDSKTWEQEWKWKYSSMLSELYDKEYSHLDFESSPSYSSHRPAHMIDRTVYTEDEWEGVFSRGRGNFSGIINNFDELTCYLDEGMLPCS